MDNQKLDDSLVAWVNCLNLSKPANNLNDLRNGEFYSNLMKLINDKCSEEIADNTCIVLIKFLQLQYLDYGKYSNVKTFDELTYNDLILLTSLLLHYTSIIDAREFFTLPMCQKLTKIEQVHVKKYLEQFDKFKNHDEMINFTVKKTQSNTLINTPMLHRNKKKVELTDNGSPLEELFQTPIRSINRVEKDQQIKKLKMELEVERMEKFELTDELKCEREKMKTISIQLREKSEELKRIQIDLFAIQNKTPPRDNSTNLNDLKRRYTSQIDSLETYVYQLQMEQEKLQNQKESLTEKSKKLEIDANLWKEKYVTCETNYNELNQKYNLQEDELQSLQIQCKELNILVEELRNTSPCDTSSILCDNNEVKGCQTLGCALTLAELDERNKEIEEVKNILKDSLNNELKLNVEIESFKDKLNSLNDKYADLQNDNDKLTEQLSNMNEIQQSLDCVKVELQQINDDLSQSKTINNELNAEICNLQKSLTTTETTLKERETCCDILQKDLAECKEKCSKFEKKYSSKNKHYTDLSKENDILQTEYALLIDKFNTTTFELNSINKNYKELDNTIEVSLQKLENVVFEDHFIKNYDDKISVINKLIEYLERNKENNSTEKRRLNDKINDLENLGRELEKRVEILTNQQEISLQEKEALQQNIKTLETYVKQLKDNITSYENKIKDLENVIVELEANISELEKMRNVIVVKDAKITELEVKTGGLKKDLKAKEEEVISIKQLQKKEEENKIQEINMLQLQIIAQRENITNLEDNLKIAINEIEVKKAELRNFEKLNEELTKDYEKTKNKLSKKINLLTDTIDKVNNELDCKTKDHKQLENLLEEQVIKCKELEIDRQYITDEYENLNRQLNKELEKLVAKELEISDKNKSIVLCEDKINKLKSDIQQKNATIHDIQALSESHDATIETLKNNIEELNSHNQQLQTTIQDLQKEIIVLNDIKMKLELKDTSLENNTEKIVNELSSKDEELKISIDNLKIYKEETIIDLENTKKKLNLTEEQLEKLTQEHLLSISEHAMQIGSLNANVKDLENQISTLNAKEAEYIDTIRLTKQELSDTVQKYTIALQTHHEIKQEYETQIETLTESLHNLVEKYNILENESKNNLDFMEDKVKNLENSNDILETQLSAEKNMYENHFKEMEIQLNSEIIDLKNKQTHLELKSEKLYNELQTSTTINYDLEKEMNEITIKLKQITSEKAELQRKHINLNDNYNKMLTDVENLKENNNAATIKWQETLAQFQKERENLLIEKKTAELKLSDFIKDIDEYKNETCTLKIKYDALLKEKDEEIQTYVTKLNEYNKRINYLTKEKDNLNNSFEKVKLEYTEYHAKSEIDALKLQELEKNYMQLKSATDLLETGNKSIKDEFDKLMTDYKKVKEKKECIEKDYNNQLQLKLTEISKLNDHISYYQECNDTKDQTIVMLETDIKNLNDKIQGKDTIMNQIRLEKENLELKLNQLKETYECKLTSKETKIHELKTLHTSTTNDLINLKINNTELKTKIDEFIKEKDNLHELLLEKESIISNLSLEKNEQESKINTLGRRLSEVSDSFTKKVEEIQEIEKQKFKLQTELNKSLLELDRSKKSRDELLDSQTKMIKETENNILRAHENAIEVKNDLLKRIELAEGETLREIELRNQIEELLKSEIESKDALKERILALECEKNKMINIYKIIKLNLNKLSCLVQEKPLTIDGEILDYDIDSLNDVIEDIELRVTGIFKKKRELSDVILHLEEDKERINIAMLQLKEEKSLLNNEKEKLLINYENLKTEKVNLENVNEEKSKVVEEFEVKFDSLQKKYENLNENSKKQDELLDENNKLQKTLNEMKDVKNKTYENYQNLMQESKKYKIKLEKLFKLRGELLEIVNKVKQNWREVETNTSQLTEVTHKQLFEKKQSLAFIVEDILKQFYRLSDRAYNSNVLLITITEQCMEEILANKTTNFDVNFAQININDIEDKLDDCKGNALHFFEQLESFKTSVEKYNAKKVKLQKENLNPINENLKSINENLNQINDNTQIYDMKLKEEEWKKKNIALKQRLTLSDNAKSVFEKKLKQLREENKRLAEKTTTIDKDVLYNNLLQEYNQSKKTYEKKIEEYDHKFDQLLKEYEKYKENEVVKKEKMNLSNQNNLKMNEIQRLRDAYSNVMTENSKLDLENNAMKKKLEQHNEELKNLKRIKQAYENLLEEHDQFKMELDTIKYKRSRDRDEYIKQLEQEKENAAKKFNETKQEWEEKLEKMRDKMTKLFKTELDKEMQKRMAESDENIYLLRTIDELKEDLKDAKIKIHKAEVERNKALDQLELIQMQKKQDLHSSRESISSIKSLDRHSKPKSIPSDRKFSTVSRSRMDVIDEATSIGASMQDLARNTAKQTIGNQMEDEGDLFNNKYLNDLQEGKCIIPKSGRDSTSSNRMSELVWRNSLVPPHLKSSYPAETQFADPNRFKDDDLKTGKIELNESLTSKLLPNDKPRKKDFGTTSYKKPGPPTPIKNGGRPSLQGNEGLVNIETKTPKRNTPNRLKALFKKRNPVIGDSSENSASTPKAKRLSFFRKP